MQIRHSFRSANPPFLSLFCTSKFVHANREKSNLIGWRQTLTTSPPITFAFFLLARKKVQNGLNLRLKEYFSSASKYCDWMKVLAASLRVGFCDHWKRAFRLEPLGSSVRTGTQASDSYAKIWRARDANDKSACTRTCSQIESSLYSPMYEQI